jgi:hypothetical protein
MIKYLKIRTYTVLAVTICLLISSVVLAKKADRINEQTAISSAAVYASLRVVSAALSTAQEAEVQVGLVVASGGVKPLKLLEPIEDTINRVASVVFWIAVASGVLSVGLWPLTYLGMTILFISLSYIAVFPSVALRSVLTRQFTSIGILLAIVVPFVFVIAPSVADLVTKSKWNEAMAVLNSASEHAGEFVDSQKGGIESDAADESFGGFLSGIKSGGVWARDVVVGGVSATKDFADTAWFYLQRADELAGALITIVAIFLLKTVIMPAVALAMFYGLFRHGIDERMLYRIRK